MGKFVFMWMEFNYPLERVKQGIFLFPYIARVLVFRKNKNNNKKYVSVYTYHLMVNLYLTLLGMLFGFYVVCQCDLRVKIRFDAKLIICLCSWT